jgi:hypothetical protein
MEFSYGGQPQIPTLQSSSAFNIPIHSERTWYINNNRIHEDLQMNTALCEIKKWYAK